MTPIIETYREGLSTIVELLTAQRDFANARCTLIRAGGPADVSRQCGVRGRHAADSLKRAVIRMNAIVIAQVDSL